MTKYNPDILCPGCLDFDYAMNRKGGVSHDVFVVCECDWKPPISDIVKAYGLSIEFNRRKMQWLETMHKEIDG